ncbi:hypothetical protein [Radiobacillus sp. PE A8.2]|uniref:hypothetical protein n=1 Tax=Radiobacillus sp. PE A8.2 TaxID=3380349 RepID=UPI00388E74B4
MNNMKIPDEVKKRLDEFHVEVPEIPIKRNKLDRLAHWIHAPAKDPFEVLSIKGNSITRLVFYPLITLLVLFFIPVFFI